MKTRIYILFWVDRDEASQSLDKFFGDVQSETNALFVYTFILLRHFAEKFEQIGLVFFTNSDASVVNFNNYRVNYGNYNIFLDYCKFLFPQTHLYEPIKGKFGWISEQVDHDLLQTLIITAYELGTVFCDLFNQLHITF